MTSKELDTWDKAVDFMRAVTKKERCTLSLLGKDGGRGGFNYGGQGGREIMLAPFVAGKKGDRVDRYTLDRDCDSPLECMLVSFFHELAHAVLNSVIPYDVINRYQREIWTTMLGVNHAKSKYNLSFSDYAVKWMIDEAQSYVVYEEVKEVHDGK